MRCPYPRLLDFNIEVAHGVDWLFEDGLSSVLNHHGARPGTFGSVTGGVEALVTATAGGGRILFGLGVAPGRFGDAVLTVWRLGVRGW